jgi:hypothetical protein
MTGALIVGALAAGGNWQEAAADRIGPPPSSLGLDSFYGKHLDADGYPIVSSPAVNDFALKEAGWLINQMLAMRPDVKQALVQGGSRFVVIGRQERTTDIPEYAWLTPKEFWDRRARGLGGSESDPVCSCGEENLLGFPGDPYEGESILIHEFAHTVHLRGLDRIDPTFSPRLKAAYDSAMARGLWRGTYAAENDREYFAEGVQSWFGANRSGGPIHNDIDTRAELIGYDPALAALISEAYGGVAFTYTRPGLRLEGHLTGWNPSAAPAFSWDDSGM